MKNFSVFVLSRNMGLLIVVLLFGATGASASNACIINGVAYVGAGASYTSCWGSGDIGTQINDAFAALAASTGGRIKVTAGNYTTGTNISFVSGTEAVFVECEPGASGTPRTQGSTFLKFTGTGAFFTFAANPGSGMANCTLVGPGGSTSTQGLICGGPTSATSCTNHSFYNIDISGFGAGLQFGDNAYVNFFYNPQIHDNGSAGENNIYVPATISAFGENISFYGGTISNKNTTSAACINLLAGKPNSGGVEFHLYGLSLDQCGITMDTNAGGFLDLQSVHMEAGISTPADFITLGALCFSCHLNISGGYMVEDHASSRTEMIALASNQANSANSVNITGMMFQTAETAPHLLNNTGTSTCCGQAYISGVTNGVGGSGVTSLVGGSWEAMSILYNATVQLGSFSRAATWSVGFGAPSGSCSSGSLYSNTSSGTPNLYVCQNGSWVGK